MTGAELSRELFGDNGTSGDSGKLDSCGALWAVWGGLFGWGFGVCRSKKPDMIVNERLICHIFPLDIRFISNS